MNPSALRRPRPTFPRSVQEGRPLGHQTFHELLEPGNEGGLPAVTLAHVLDGRLPFLAQPRFLVAPLRAREVGERESIVLALSFVDDAKAERAVQPRRHSRM